MAFTNYNLFELVNVITKKEREGALKYDQFNTLLEVENRNHFDYHWQFYEKNQKSTDTLSPFKEISQNDLIGSGSVSDDFFDAYVNLPNDYAHLIPGSIKTGEGYMVEKLIDVEWNLRNSQIIKAPTTKYPVCVFRNGFIEVVPVTIDSVEFTYLRYPKTPYMDGYVDASGEFQYLDEGETKELSANETALDGSSDTSYDSKTVELEWKMEDKIEIAARILADVGVSIDKMSLWQYRKMMQQEDQ